MLSKLIIFEGMDRCGKDTQIKNIISNYKDEVFHMLHYHVVAGRTAEESRRMHEKTHRETFELCKLAADSGFNIILNRSHYGEYVYGKIYRNYIDPEYIFDLEKEYDFKSWFDSVYLIILINSDIKEMIRREDGASLSKGKAYNLIEEAARFEDVSDKSTIDNVLLVDSAGMRISDVSEVITSWLNGVRV